jgi:predicted N-acetyltransferase YhbS
MSEQPEVRGAGPEEFDRVVTCIATAFGSEQDDWPRVHAWRDPNHRPELHRVCVVDGEVVSALRVVVQDVRYNRAALKHYGIADVGTPPPHRERGYSTRCLQDAIAFMEAEGAHFSTLYTGIQPFYARLGWATLPLQAPTFTLPDSVRMPEGIEVLPLSREAHLDGVRAVYEALNVAKTATTIRDDRYWQLRFARDDARWRVAIMDGEVAAYICTQTHDETLRVLEYGWSRGRSRALAAVFADAMGRGTEAGAQRMVCQFGDDDMGQEVVGRLASPAPPITWEHLMFRIIDLRGLLEAIEPVLRERAHRARELPEGAAINLIWDRLAASLRYDIELVTIGGPLPGRPTLELSSADLVQLIFGVGGRQLAPVRQLPYKERRLLEVMFPGEHFVFWETDAF